VTMPIITNELTIDRVFYVPTTITINYPTTTNTQLGNITTVGSGQYNYAGNANSFTFIAKSVDIYTFSFTINYANVSLNDILIDVWEGDRAAQGETWTAVASSYTLYFTLSLTVEPSFPSAAAVANESMYQWQQLFQENLAANRQSADAAQANSLTADVVSTIAVVVAIIAVVLFADFQRRKNLEESSGTNQLQTEVSL